jgi:hypothetical protein
MTEPKESLDTALDALGEAMHRIAAKLHEHPTAGPAAARLAASFGATLDGLAADPHAGKVAVTQALAAVTRVVSDASSSDPERRAAATDALNALRDKVVGPDAPLRDAAERASAWAQRTAAAGPAPTTTDQARARLDDLWTQLRTRAAELSAGATSEAPADPARADEPTER